MSKVGIIKGFFSLIVMVINLFIRFGVTISVIVSMGVCAKHWGELGKKILEKKQEVLDLIYWRDPKKSGIAFGATFILLVCLHCFSVISVFAYTGLLLLSLTLSFRLYKFILAKVQKGEEGNPFKSYLEKDLAVPQEKVHKQVDVVLKHTQDFFNQLRRLVLIEDIVETAKFGVLLWALTYVGAWFSGMTLLILALIGAFTIPKFYETYKEPIDQYWGIVQGHVQPIMEQIQEKVPFLKKQKTQ